MLEQMEIEVTSRDERGKNAARRLRATGRVPATLYGLGQDPVALALDTKVITGLLSHHKERNRVLQLKGGAAGTAMAVDWQVDPVDSKLLHVDLQRVDVNVPVVADVTVATKGVSYGVKTEGGMEDLILRQVRVQCLPADLPEVIEIDVTALRAGDSVRLADLQAGAPYKILGNPTMMVVRIVGKRSDAKGGEGAAEAEAK